MYRPLPRIPDGPRDAILVLSLSISRRLDGPLERQLTETGAELALDNSGRTSDSLAARSCHFVHVGRLYPHPAGPGDRRDFDPGHPGTQSRLATIRFSNRRPETVDFLAQACRSVAVVNQIWPARMQLSRSAHA